VRAHGLGGIEFAGEVSATDLPRYYQSCDVFCSPATSGESFGMVLLEAMALGKPVVATAIDGYRQVMEDDVQGRLVASRDAAGLAAALRELLNSSALRRRMGAQGKVTAAAYSWERVSAHLLRFYDEIRLNSMGHGWLPSVDLIDHGRPAKIGVGTSVGPVDGPGGATAGLGLAPPGNS
jgi:phosphatidyl-myo-inositol alpha-mannosyltransferase